jgi:PAS domain-containing protein
VQGNTQANLRENRPLASWLVARKREIEGSMAVSLGPAAPAASSPESEALRRFRSFTSTALVRGRTSAPPLDGLRLNERRVTALLQAWRDAAAKLSGPLESELREALDPLIQHFRLSIRSSAPGRKARGTPRAARRAVIAAIDRVADAFLAIDVDTGRIVDANPAAGALLGVNRDALLEVDFVSFVPTSAQAEWWTELDGLCEGNDIRNFSAVISDTNGGILQVEVSMTRFATRNRTLALALMRTQSLSGWRSPAERERARI